MNKVKVFFAPSKAVGITQISMHANEQGIQPDNVYFQTIRTNKAIPMINDAETRFVASIPDLSTKTRPSL